ncbi:uncharacterized protein LOC127259683 [Andrographis paniculata]|uniref:uncharacterized protein LOC127259683 n=1 Tax=Andrographis paniculata TaxID=175694 RepID=UPI0021E7673B|nr:uncharacterized protein LOC127259683 [Andrographis paniculata]XP_051143170.1 uncharacterized protein LOC127259683 [Andrographis paniculata]XP_051143177.1 uncharacterized protein LOC127259683 [Andrographis paniculata]
MPYLVRERLFFGNITDAAEILQNGSNEFTHILSVLSSDSISFFSEWRRLSIPSKHIRKVYVADLKAEDISNNALRSSLPPQKLLYSLEYAGQDLKFVRMAVPLRDSENEDLLDHLDVCLDFIEDAKKEGSVLVHCFAGVSRSVAIIMAYVMRTERLSQEDALESLRQCCESVCPNDGFLEQLKMFEQMGYKVDHASPIYKRFRLKVLGDSYNRGDKLDGSRFAPDPGLPAEKSSSDSEASSVERDGPHYPAYSCKKCHRIVASLENVVDHVPGEGDTWPKRNRYNQSNDNECSSVFVEPIQWMTTVEEGGVEGKLVCPKCAGRVGYFNWSGIQCSCGSWITPAFQLHKGCVDITRKSP